MTISKKRRKIREFWGNVPQLVRAYGWPAPWAREGISAASDLSVLANNYMEPRLHYKLLRKQNCTQIFSNGGSR